VVIVAVILGDGRNPDSVKSHTLNIIELVLDALEGTTAVFVDVWARISAPIVSPESIS
jgi:hypothetical protein